MIGKTKHNWSDLPARVIIESGYAAICHAGEGPTYAHFLTSQRGAFERLLLIYQRFKFPNGGTPAHQILLQVPSLPFLHLQKSQFLFPL